MIDVARPVDGLTAPCHAVYHYEVARDLVWALKTGRDRHRFDETAAALATTVRAVYGRARVDAVVPLPASSAGWGVRGFDQAARLAVRLGITLDLPVARLLRRRPGRRQVGADRADRRIGPDLLLRRRPPGSVLLVDDVVTTGGTLAAAARVLRAGGACEVRAVAVALA